MSIWGHRISVKLIAMCVAVLTLGAFAAALSRPAPREITLVTRGMAFYLEGGDLPNPTLTVRAGERVRVVLRNDDRGIRHDFAVPDVSAALDPIGWNESSDVTFEVPGTPGTYEYHCRPHMMMMRGRIVVQ
jgi:FtsP/CotA-like multicopper oxidase with cupredoxin domain